jgi:hypothetical protein
MQWLLAVMLALSLAIHAAPASGQSSTEIMVDVPTAGSTVASGTQVLIGGWAVDRNATSGTGIDQVRVYLDGPMEGGGTLLGNATLGVSRPDVAQALGNQAYANAGYNFLWTPTNLSGGSHTFYVYAHSTASNTNAYKSVGVTASGPPATPSGTSAGMGPGMGQGGMPYPYDLMGYGGGMYPPPPPPPPPLYPPPIPCPAIYPPPPGCGGYGALQPPSNVTVASVTTTSVNLTWTSVPGAVTYRVLQSTGTSSGFVPAAVTNLTSTGASVTGLATGVTYSFQVVAVDAFGQQSTPSATVTATTGVMVNPLMLGPAPQFAGEAFPVGPYPPGYPAPMGYPSPAGSSNGLYPYPPGNPAPVMR